ncbi:bifunctional phosphopantothenoylcysteine decarboxylase/phosphopantothenate--cysteine ligase CoaBC [bacterium]|nr:bifunctional phosphopantothenoylcysteine decarboxylase/phosphopantothenate--cysteine ligase CoaBC [bacterium]
MKYAGKKILIGITGGISAYKMAEAVRYFIKNGAELRVIMTRSACEFITPLTIETLSKNKVTTEIFPGRDPLASDVTGTHHIDLAQWADVFLIAPATGNIIGKIANGIADDPLSTVVMASTAPVIIAPAMNDKMWLNPIVQKNVEALKSYGYRFVDPEFGFLAEGYEGVGRLAELEKIYWAVDKTLFGSDALKGKRILVTAGPTQEAWDAVRFLTNHSSGKMGYAVARQAALMGAEVTLISGPVSLLAPPDVKVENVTSAEAMKTTVEKYFKETDILIMTAAVADYKPVTSAANKIKKQPGVTKIQIELEETPDILASVAVQKQHRIIVGFAIETDNELANAKKKLETKHLDFIVLNNPKEPGAGFNHDTNIITIVDSRDVKKYPLMSKHEAARTILGKVVTLVSGSSL